MKKCLTNTVLTSEWLASLRELPCGFQTFYSSQTCEPISWKKKKSKTALTKPHLTCVFPHTHGVCVCVCVCVDAFFTILARVR
jgi:hypothetical protein